jgi:phosphoesterase RecJ-like protein
VSRVDWSDLAGRIRKARSVVLGTHINADGDGLGCEIALWHFLRSLGLEPSIVNNEPVPDKYLFLNGHEAIEIYDPGRHSELIRNADLFVMLDNSSVERLALLRPDVEAARGLKVCIDHHSTINPFWDLNCVDTAACASGELIHELIGHMGGEITPEIAEALYVAYVTDTGHFRFSKTTASSHRVVAELMEIGRICPSRIHGEIYEKTAGGMAILTGIALSGLRFTSDRRIAWMRMTNRQVSDCEAEEEDTGDLVNHCLSIRGVQAGALFREMPDGKIKVSLRSKGNIDVHILAARHNGGGHRNAAGILMPVSLPEAERVVIEELTRIVSDAAPEGAAGALESR